MLRMFKKIVMENLSNTLTISFDGFLDFSQKYIDSSPEVLALFKKLMNDDKCPTSLELFYTVIYKLENIKVYEYENRFYFRCRSMEELTTFRLKYSDILASCDVKLV